MRRSRIFQPRIDSSQNAISCTNITQVLFSHLRLGGGVFGDPGQPGQPGAQHRQRRVRLLPTALRRPDPRARGLRQRGVEGDHFLRQTHLQRWEADGCLPSCSCVFAQKILSDGVALARQTPVVTCDGRIFTPAN